MKAWNPVGTNGLPVNWATKCHYTGINVLTLWLSSMLSGYSSNVWLTYKQAQQLKGYVIKGEVGTPCFFYQIKEIEDKETKEMVSVPILKPFTVFNLEQVDGIDFGKVIPQNNFDPIEKGEKLLNATGVEIKYGGFTSCYDRIQDRISLPPRSCFKSKADFYSVALHELIHWSGSPKRLNRTKGKTYGDNDYAFEELVAEIGSAFLCAEIGLVGDLQHASYIESWLKILQKDEHAIFRAAALASKAHKYIIAFDSQTEPKVVNGSMAST